MKWMRCPRLLAAVALVLLPLSCGPKRPPLFPVNGQVSFKGKPTPGALVVFNLVDNKDPRAPRPSGYVQADGSFSLRTYPGTEGAPEGEYTVSIVWTDPKDIPDRSTSEVPNKLPAIYANPRTSKLHAKVQPGADNRPTFRLEP
jgi:hypothetical protein